MPSFVTRVELKGETPDYGALDASMKENGFAPFIRHSNGKIFQLPSATYYSSYSVEMVTSQMVSVEAQKIGDAITPGSLVLTIPAEGWTGVLVEAA